MESLFEQIKKESRRTKPDFFAYVPDVSGYEEPEIFNEHFLVFEGPGENLMAVFTQSSKKEVTGGITTLVTRAMFMKSRDDGKTWSEPSVISDPYTEIKGNMAGWAFPMVSKKGRIYVLYNRSVRTLANIYFHTGVIEGVYSDDLGKTWSQPERLYMERSIYDDPRGMEGAEWIVWQKPERDKNGSYFVGYSRWYHPNVSTLGKIHWTLIDSVVEFMRFTNIDENPSVKNIKISYSAFGENALRVPHYIYPEISICQEPSIVRLPDFSLFCVMRTGSGYIWWSRSFDEGETWSGTRPLLYKDFGRPMLNPIAPDPIFKLSDGRYVIFYHNHRGFMNKEHPSHEAEPRNPLFMAFGRYMPGADQPLWFDEPVKLFDTECYTVNGMKKDEENNPFTNTSLSMYSSFTSRNGVDVLWYPDRKFNLLGKIVK